MAPGDLTSGGWGDPLPEGISAPHGGAQPPARAQRLTFHGSVLVVTLAVLLLMAVPPARQLYREHAQVQAAERKLQALKRDNARLDEHLARLKDPDYLEKLARRELGLVRPGEIGYVVVPGETAPKKDAAPARPPHPWYERIIRSLKNVVGVG